MNMGLTRKHLGLAAGALALAWVLWPAGTNGDAGSTIPGQGLEPQPEGTFAAVIMHELERPELAPGLDDADSDADVFDERRGGFRAARGPGRPSSLTGIPPPRRVRTGEGTRHLLGDTEEGLPTGVGATSWGWLNDSVQAAERDRSALSPSAFRDPFTVSLGDPYADSMLAPGFNGEFDDTFPGLDPDDGLTSPGSAASLFPGQTAEPDRETTTPFYSGDLW